MGRVRANIQVRGRDRWTLFDTGARSTYIVARAARGLHPLPLAEPIPAALGGQRLEVRKACILQAYVEGLPITTHARVIDEIGEDEDGKSIDVLFGALAMQEWGIRPLPDQERLDMTHYPREFVEF